MHAPGRNPAERPDRSDLARAGVERAFHALADAIGRWAPAVRLDPTILTERAALLGLAQAGRVSSNGTCRLLRCADDWIAINLPRPDDLDAVPALLGEEVGGNPWQALERCLPQRRAADIRAQAMLLGLAVAIVGETEAPAVDYLDAADPLLASAQPWRRPPRVLDLSALWAGPLCGAILAEAGCAVTKVEFARRPDSTAARSPAFDARLNGRKRRLTLDALDALRPLIAEADCIITSARPRAFAALGLAPLPPDALWIAITGHGLRSPDDVRIGFGDDCAAAGGLVGRGMSFLGDALADPLTGLHAALVALRGLATGQRGIRDVSLAGTAALCRTLAADG